MLKKNMKFVVILTVIFLMTFNVTGVFAKPPLAIQIEVDEWIGIGGAEPFIASGPAVDNGRICATGTVEDLSITGNDSQGPFRILRVYKRFYCDDLSGNFDIEMVVQLNKTTHYTKAKWHIVAGTGEYLKLQGEGSLVGTPIDPGVSITDIYDGQVH